MAPSTRLLFFGNEIADESHSLREQLVLGRANPFLCLFLQKAHLKLRREISQLSPLGRSRVPSFSTIEELAERASALTTRHAGIESALLCISQLARYIEYVFLR